MLGESGSYYQSDFIDLDLFISSKYFSSLKDCNESMLAS